jgi:hypothetical protein
MVFSGRRAKAQIQSCATASGPEATHECLATIAAVRRKDAANDQETRKSESHAENNAIAKPAWAKGNSFSP